MKKKKLSLLLVCIMAVTLFLSSCQSLVQNKSGDSSIGAAAPQKRVPLKILFPPYTATVPSDVDPQNNKWTDIYRKAFPEVDFEFIVGNSSGAAERKALMLASNDIPDMMPASQLELIQFSEDGIIIPLDDIVKKHYTNVYKFINEEDMKVAKYNGKLWGLCAPNNSLQNPEIMYIRKDWLDNLNMNAPATIDELYDVLKAFTQKDPDKNGKNDTYGIGGNSDLSQFNGIFAPFDVIQGWWSRVNGKLVQDNIRPEMKEALGFIRKIYTEGWMDKAAATQNASTATKNMLANKYGVYSHTSFAMNRNYNTEIKKSFGGEFISLQPIKGPKGTKWIQRGKNTGYIHVVSSQCKNPEYPAKIMNWMLEQDKTKPYYTLNTDLINFGEIGINGQVIGKFMNSIPAEQLNEEGKQNTYRYQYRLMYASANMLNDQDMIVHAEDQVKEGVTHKNYPVDRKMVKDFGHYNEAIVSGKETARIQPDLDKYFDEVKMKIITGALPLDAFDQWVSYYYKNGGDIIDEEINRMNPAK